MIQSLEPSKEIIMQFMIKASLILLMLYCVPVTAAVVDSAPNGFTVTNRVTVSTTPAKAYDAIFRIGNWWSSEHTFFGQSKNMRLENNIGGCFCEVKWKQQVLHGTVVYIDPGKTIRISTALGPLQEQGVAGALTFQVKPAADGAEIEMTYRVGGYMPGGLDKIAPIVDSVQSMIAARLGRYVDTGNAEEKK